MSKGFVFWAGSLPGFKIVLLLLSFSLGTSARAQQSGLGSSSGGCPGVCGTPTTPALSYVETETRIQTLSNGVRITEVTETRRAMDGAGRFREQRRQLRGGQPQAEYISIRDPVAHTSIILHPKTRVAEIHRETEADIQFVPSPLQEAFGKAMIPEHEPLRRVSTQREVEPLAPVVIDGEVVEGMRSTTVIAAGEQGNDGELRTVQESYFSKKLAMTVRTVYDDPVRGRMTTEITEFYRGEPDPSLFKIPDDYQSFDLTPTQHVP